jgi:glycosyltransferase involved in cell wall biosynthesis
MLVSILMPTRNRLQNLEKAVTSIVNTASSKNNYEILFGVDSDDQNSIESIPVLLQDKNINYKIIITERKYYKGFHLYLYELYKNSSGDLLWSFPDDLEILTKNWDLLLLENKNSFYIMVDMGPAYSNWTFSLVPIISRKWIEITNRFAENSQTDLWLGEIARELKIIQQVPILTNLFCFSNTVQHNMEHYFSTECIQQRHDDLTKIKNFLTL